MKTIHLITATRPNFMKLAPLAKALEQENWCEYKIIHTGQHYDHNMSEVFFEDLNIPHPDVNLGIGSGTHAEQTGKTMIEYERLLFKETPDIVIVFGDVNATLACALAARKLHISVGHVEAGLRSGDMEMPEEINRILTDHVSDILWTTSKKANETLKKEGISEEKIHFAGDIMLDTLENSKGKIKKRKTYEQYVGNDAYAVVTLHRPQNVDTMEGLKKLVEMVEQITKKLPVIFPVHPRTEKNLRRENLWEKINEIKDLQIISAQGYIDFMSLVSNAKFVVSDSGGTQSETTYLNVPCITVRNTTEKPQTISRGTNVLAKTEEVMEHIEKILRNDWKQKQDIEGWDGKAAERLCESLKIFSNKR